MTPQTIKLHVRNSYGHARYYSAPDPNNATAGLFLRLLGQQSFTADQLKIIKSLGYTLEITPLTEINPL